MTRAISNKLLSAGDMAKTKLLTFLRSIMLLLFLVSWVSLKTIAKDGNVQVSTNGVKGKNR